MRVFFFGKEGVVLNHKRIVHLRPFTEKTLRKLKITNATPKKIENYKRHSKFQGRLLPRSRPPQSVGAKAIPAICTSDEVHKVETAEEDLLLGDEAE
jgi:hypothetical protein